MQTKNVLYAAVGAPVVAARKVTDQMSKLKGRVSNESSSYAEAASKAIDSWATEGEKLVSGIRDGNVVEEISQKVDLDQAKEQVSKLRDQLEDMLDTWRHSFRPESAEEAGPADKTAAKTTQKSSTTPKKPAAEKSTASEPAAKSSAAQTTKSSTAAKKSSAKSTSKSETSKTKAS